MIKERIKTFVLTALFITSLVLTALNLDLTDHFSGYSDFFASIENTRDIEYHFKPSRLFVHFAGGDGNNVEIIEQKSEYWQQLKEILNAEIGKASRVGEVDESGVQKLADMRTVEVQLAFPSEGRILSKAIGLDKSILDSYKGIDTIIIPLVDDGGIYFLLSQGGAVRVETGGVKKLAIIDELEGSMNEGKLVKYYSIKSLLGIESNLLIPIDSSNYKYPYFKSKSSIDIKNEDALVEMAQNVFKEKYDFVNRVIETGGANSFIYGFGERVLRIQPDGKIEYLNETVSKAQIDQFEAFSRVSRLLSEMGIDSKEIYLVSAEKTKIKGSDAYVFSFSYNIDGLRFSSETGIEHIKATVAGDEVYSLTGMIVGIEDNMAYNVFSDLNTLSPQAILNENFDFFKSELAPGEEQGIEMTENVLSRFRSIELVYFLSDENMFIPSWSFETEDSRYVFDAYTGERLSYGLGKS